MYTSQAFIYLKFNRNRYRLRAYNSLIYKNSSSINGGRIANIYNIAASMHII